MAVLPRVFIDFSIEDQPLGRVIFELFTDTAPRTSENFRALCTGEKGISPTTGHALHYKGSPVHRVIAGFMVQAGDFTKGNGTGGQSIFGGNFEDEDLSRPVDKEGLLCMANKGPHTNGSQIFITLAPSSHLTGKHVVFGRVVRGFEDVVRAIEKVPTDGKDRPVNAVVISGCGELVRVAKETGEFICSM
ncbi:cyclophilin-like domain-containing protein [Pterulicium gracile]|uniref:Peptidyl-prolyl cis-trans isomerase n=1 Tax=Pterulicium gracile TaxID=1884261 RepID=A0A5C3Q6J4_9AGAR|nr:cyclophilin-like domain-containing protein [Pterula gracilis]